MKSPALVSQDESWKYVEYILRSKAAEIVKGHTATGGAPVFVAHVPSAGWRSVFKRAGIKLRKGDTTVLAMHPDSVASFFDAQDLATRRWGEAAPVDRQIRIFYIAGSGSALLTLHFEEEGIRIEKVPDVYPVA